MTAGGCQNNEGARRSLLFFSGGRLAPPCWSPYRTVRTSSSYPPRYRQSAPILDINRHGKFLFVCAHKCAFPRPSRTRTSLLQCPPPPTPPLVRLQAMEADRPSLRDGASSKSIECLIQTHPRAWPSSRSSPPSCFTCAVRCLTCLLCRHPSPASVSQAMRPQRSTSRAWCIPRCACCASR